MTRPFMSLRFRESTVLIRQEPGSRNEFGEWVPGAETETELDVVSAPPSAATVRDVLPEGARLHDWRTFWFEHSARPLRVGQGQTDGDVIEYAGIRYRIRHVQDWQPHGFVEVLAVREEGQSD